MPPLAGAGLALGNNVVGDNGQMVCGYSVLGHFAQLDIDTKFSHIDVVWLDDKLIRMSSVPSLERYQAQGLKVAAEC